MDDVPPTPSELRMLERIDLRSILANGADSAHERASPHQIIGTEGLQATQRFGPQAATHRFIQIGEDIVVDPVLGQIEVRLRREPML